MCNMSLERHQNQFPLIVWCDCTSAETRRFNSVYRNRNTIKAPHGCLHLISICVWQSRWKLESHWTHLCCILLLLLCFSWDRMQLQSDLILFRSVFFLSSIHVFRSQHTASNFIEKLNVTQSHLCLFAATLRVLWKTLCGNIVTTLLSNTGNADKIF